MPRIVRLVSAIAPSMAVLQGRCVRSTCFVYCVEVLFHFKLNAFTAGNPFLATNHVELV